MQRPNRHTNRPVGQITRGKTAPNRLRGVDRFLAAYDPWLVRRTDGPFRRALYVDLGYGATADTALESAARLRRLNPQLPLLGTEIEPERVERALPFAGERTHFRLGGFNLPLQTDALGRPERVRLVRAFNVLRQYEEHEAAPAIDSIMARVLPGGLLVEGTSDPFGRVWTANLIRRTGGSGPDGWTLEALVLGTNLGVDFDVDAFQTRLPKSFIHRVVPGDPVFDFITAFKAAARETRHCRVWGPRAWFTATGGALRDSGHDIARPDRWLRRGWLVWRRPGLDLDRRQVG